MAYTSDGQIQVKCQILWNHTNYDKIGFDTVFLKNGIRLNVYSENNLEQIILYRKTKIIGGKIRGPPPPYIFNFGKTKTLERFNSLKMTKSKRAML